MPNSGLSRRKRRSQIPGFTPAKLFASSEVGVWYDPSDLSPEKVSWRRNQFLWSEDFTQWTQSNCSVQANVVTAPNGTLTADKLVINNGVAANSADGTGVQRSGSVTAGTYVYSVYAKAAEFTSIRFRENAATGAFLTCDLLTGAFSGGNATYFVNPTATNVGDGWWRVSFTTAVTFSGLNGYSIRVANTGDGTSGIYIWGAQLEPGTTVGTYQRITDFSSDFLAAFPTHTLYQNSLGNIPVTVLGQSVGLVLDKSQGALSNIGAELVTNGGFSNDITGWTVSGNGIGSVVNGWGRIQNNGTVNRTMSQTILTIGRTYIVTGIARGDGSAGVPTIFSGNIVWSGTASTATQNIYAIFTATNTAFNVMATGSATGPYAEFDNISVREVPGNHARQTTDAARPTLQARSNLLTYSEQFDNAAWTKRTGTTVTANSAVAPDGTTTADTLNEGTTAATYHDVYRTGVSVGNATYVYSCYAKNVDGRYLNLANATSQTAYAAAIFDLQTATVASTATGVGAGFTSVSATISDAGNGWYRCALTFTLTNGQSAGANVAMANGTVIGDFGVTTYTGTGRTILIWGAQFELASSASTYQRVVTATDYADVGGPRSLTFDGVDDSLVTAGNVNFSGTDKMTVCAGVFKGSDAAIGTVVELSTVSGNLDGSFMLTTAGQASAGAKYGSTLRGTALIYSDSPASYPAPISNVVSLLSDISQSTATDEQQMRVNGTQVVLTTVGADAGTGNFGTYPLFIGRRNQATLPFNGRIHQLIIRGAATDSVTVQQTERFVAQKTGVTL